MTSEPRESPFDRLFESASEAAAPEPFVARVRADVLRGGAFERGFLSSPSAQPLEARELLARDRARDRMRAEGLLARPAPKIGKSTEGPRSHDRSFVDLFTGGWRGVARGRRERWGRAPAGSRPGRPIERILADLQRAAAANRSLALDARLRRGESIDDAARDRRTEPDLRSKLSAPIEGRPLRRALIISGLVLTIAAALGDLRLPVPADARPHGSTLTAQRTFDQH